ncbi:hypothetical protein, partial [Haloferax profundi]|uniref:hypothetical protein n=1 Tax=Haloferax profundi TaxID=1544718 RepID=UPI000A6F96A3
MSEPTSMEPWQMIQEQEFKEKVESDIERCGSELELSTPLVVMAKRLYSQYNSVDVAYSRPTDEFALSVIYLAHKVLGEPVTVSEITSDLRVREKAVFRVTRRIKRDLAENHGLKLQVTTAEDYLDKYANQLDTSNEVVSYAKKLLDKNCELLMNK